MKSTQLTSTLTALALCMCMQAVHAQEKFPVKNIRMLVPFAAGSQTDILARWIGEKFLETWGQQVVVDNRPSAGGTIASQYVLDANFDGHTMMMVSTGHAGNATLFSKLPYDTIKDFAGVSQVASVPNLLVVAPSLGAKSMKDARRSVRSPAPMRSSSRPVYRKPAAARSCAASCARSPRTIPAIWAISRRWRTPAWWRVWWRTGWAEAQRSASASPRRSMTIARRAAARESSQRPSASSRS